MTFTTLRDTLVSFEDLTEKGSKLIEGNVVMDGTEYVITLEWNVKHRWFNMRVARFPSRAHVFRAVVTLDRPTIVRNFNPATPDRPDAQFVFIAQGGQLDEINPGNISDVNLLVTHGVAS